MNLFRTAVFAAFLSLVPLALFADATADPVAAPEVASSPEADRAPRTAPSLRIGFIDLDTVLQESRAVREHLGRIEDQVEARRREVERKSSEFSRLREALERQDSLLSDQEKAARRRRIQELRLELEDLQYEAGRHLRQTERGVIEPVLDAVMDTVRHLGVREGYDLILRGELVLYGSEAVDLTERLVRELDSKPLMVPGVSPPAPVSEVDAPLSEAPAPTPADPDTADPDTADTDTPPAADSLPLIP